jgi:hypothetical protein
VNRGQLLGRRVHDGQQAIEDVAQCVLARKLEIGSGVEEDVDRRRHGAAAAVAEHDDQLEALAQVFGRVLEAAHAFRAQSIACHADNEEIVGPFVRSSRAPRRKDAASARRRRRRVRDRAHRPE